MLAEDYPDFVSRFDIDGHYTLALEGMIQDG
jgi:hypothetical protein